MDLNDIKVDIKSFSVSIVETTTKTVFIDDDEVAEEDRHKQVQVKLAKPYLHINCVLESVFSDNFTAGCDYVDSDGYTYHAIDTNNIVLVTQKISQYVSPKEVSMFNKPYKEGNHA